MWQPPRRGFPQNAEGSRPECGGQGAELSRMWPRTEIHCQEGCCSEFCTKMPPRRGWSWERGSRILLHLSPLPPRNKLLSPEASSRLHEAAKSEQGAPVARTSKQLTVFKLKLRDERAARPSSGGRWRDTLSGFESVLCLSGFLSALELVCPQGNKKALRSRTYAPWKAVS